MTDLERENRELRARLEEAEETLRAIQGGEIDALVVSGVDGDRGNTLEGAERRRAEEALHASEERYLTLFQNTDDLIQFVSPSGEFLAVNKKWTSVLEYSQEDAITMRVTDILREDEIPKIAGLLSSLTQEKSIRVETVFVSRSGKEIYVDGSGIGVFKDGKYVHAAGIFRDVTERNKLRIRVAQSDHLASLGLLAAGVAHEVNNPLTYTLYNLETVVEDLPQVVSGYARWLAQSGPEGGPDEPSEMLDPARAYELVDLARQALEGAERIRSIAHTLGTFTRVDDEKLEPINLRDAAENARNMASNEIKYRAKLVLDFGSTPAVLGSEGKLSQVFLNLIVNAAHAIDEGDIENNIIRIHTYSDGDHVVAEVSDTGKGIPKEHHARIFDPFFTTKDVGEGSGLGLSISAKIVADLGGEISFESEEGRGSTFRIRLPALTSDCDQVTRSAATKPGADAGATRGRILVVDYEEGIRAAMAHMLGTDHEVLTASSGAQGKEVLESDQAFDLLILDLMMPKMSGIDLHRWLAETHPQLASRVIFVTGGVFTPVARQYLNKVSTLTFEKPLNTDNFKKTVAKLIVPHHTMRP